MVLVYAPNSRVGREFFSHEISPLLVFEGLVFCVGDVNKVRYLEKRRIVRLCPTQ